jgi:hypothetical protein
MPVTNTVLIDARCPVCDQTAVIHARTQVAASLHGDERGPFCGRIYKLGQRMAWWPGDCAWRFEGELHQPWDTALEACPSECATCGATLSALIRFKNLIVDSLVSLCA